MVFWKILIPQKFSFVLVKIFAEICSVSISIFFIYSLSRYVIHLVNLITHNCFFRYSFPNEKRRHIEEDARYESCPWKRNQGTSKIELAFSKYLNEGICIYNTHICNHIKFTYLRKFAFNRAFICLCSINEYIELKRCQVSPQFLIIHEREFNYPFLSKLKLQTSWMLFNGCYFAMCFKTLSIIYDGAFHENN